jgi:hypothetical protein
MCGSYTSSPPNTFMACSGTDLALMSCKILSQHFFPGLKHGVLLPHSLGHIRPVTTCNQDREMICYLLLVATSLFFCISKDFNEKAKAVSLHDMNALGGEEI